MGKARPRIPPCRWTDTTGADRSSSNESTLGSARGSLTGVNLIRLGAAALGLMPDRRRHDSTPSPPCERGSFLEPMLYLSFPCELVNIIRVVKPVQNVRRI